MSAKSMPAVAPTVAVMTSEVPPTLVPAAVDAGAAEPKRGAKRPRKEVVDAAAVGATAATSATVAPKKAKGRAKAEGAAPPAEDVATSPVEESDKTGEPGTWLIVAKTVRGLLKSNPAYPMHCGSDALPALNARVVELIQEGMARAVANNRKTLKSADF